MLSIYSETSACPKCGCTAADTKWCGGATNPDHVPGCVVEGEHLHRTCARCGYMRLELPLDMPPEEPTP